MNSRVSRSLVVLLSVVCLFLFVSSCRSRGRQSVKTAPAPVSAATPAESMTVTPPADEFVRDDVEPEITTTDLRELNRTAQARGWIRDVFFAYDSATLDRAAREALETSAAWLERNPVYRLLIEGHCDERGTEQYNLALGERRANAARDYLIQLGIDSNRLRTISYGEERPFALGHHESAWAQNRRAHLVVEGQTFLGALSN